MFRFRMTLFIAVLALPNQANADMQTLRTEENGVVHHQLESCGFERGVATAVYHFRKHVPYRPTEIQLTDICFDRTTGELWASESESRLTLVRQEEQQDVYEVLLPDTQPFQRWSVSIGNYDISVNDAGGYRAGSVSFSYARKASKKLNWEHTGTQLDGDVRLIGYLFDKQPAVNSIATNFKVEVGGQDYWDHLRSRNDEHRGREAPIIQFEGDLSFDGAIGTADLRNTWETGKEGSGRLELTVNDKGELSGSGTLNLANARLAGINPHDWKTTTWEIKKLVGHMVGENGDQFNALAIVGGKTVDHDGVENPVMGSLSIGGYSEDLMEQWGKLYRTESENQ